MLRRLLNIASIVCLVLCMALMGMWVRSYYRCDAVGGQLTKTNALSLRSAVGRLLWWFEFTGDGPARSPTMESTPIDHWTIEQVNDISPFAGFGVGAMGPAT